MASTAEAHAFDTQSNAANSVRLQKTKTDSGACRYRRLTGDEASRSSASFPSEGRLSSAYEVDEEEAAPEGEAEGDMERMERRNEHKEGGGQRATVAKYTTPDR
jgi:hypothetical protein